MTSGGSPGRAQAARWLNPKFMRGLLLRNGKNSRKTTPSIVLFAHEFW
jgi:hypothetical protein